MKIELSRQAERQWQRLGAVAQEKIAAKLDAYVADPAAFRNQVKKLQNMDAWRLRVGDYRVIFNEDGVIFLVLQVGHRREIYR